MPLASLIVATLCLPWQSAAIERQLERAELKGAQVAVAVLDVDSGQRVFWRQAELPLAPASNMKVLTTAGALLAFGPEAVFATRFETTAAISDAGRLQGDLVLVGGGDPCLRPGLLGLDAGGADPLRVLASLLLAAGVTGVDGRLLLDDGLFDRQWVHEDWSPGDLDLAYAAPIGALSAFGNCLALDVDGGGSPAARLVSDVAGFAVRNELRLADKSNTFAVGALRPDAQGIVVVRGEVGRAVGGRRIEVPVREPSAWFGALLARQLERAEIDVRDGLHVAAGAAPAAGRVLGSLETPLENALVLANKESDNFVADHLLKLLGARLAGEGSFAAGGRALAEYLGARTGAPLDGVVVRDGSGLSARNRVTARLIVETLATVARAEPAVRDRFLRSLPVSGTDGSLGQRLTEAPYAGAVRAKTGFIKGVSGLSGYARTRGGRTLAFSILINGYNPRYGNTQMKAVQDDICRALVDGS